MGEATGQPCSVRGESEDRGGSAGFGSHSGSAGTARRGRCWWPAGAAACSGRQQRGAASRPGSSGCDRRQGGLRLRRPDLSLRLWTHSCGGVRKPTRGVAGTIFRLGRGKLGVLDPHSLVPGLLQRVDFSDFERSATGGSQQLRILGRFRRPFFQTRK